MICRKCKHWKFQPRRDKYFDIGVHYCDILGGNGYFLKDRKLHCGGVKFEPKSATGKMIKIEYITEETRKLLEQCGCPDVADELDDTETYITQAQAMRWLREEKDLPLIVVPTSCMGERCKSWGYAEGFYYGKDFYGFCNNYLYESYEEAAEHGIQEACKYLLKE